jgi:hypothetical protein
MAYRIEGTYVATCNCQLMCPCPFDGPPTGENGQCRGVGAWAIRAGNLDDTDLAGVNFALWNLFTSNISAGNWTMGVVVDEGASEEQTQALERILSGQEGGPFADFAPLIGDNRGIQRARVSVSDGSASIGGLGDVSFEPTVGPSGSPATVSGAPFGFAETFKVGKGSGHVTSPVGDFDSVYGESGDYVYASEGGPEVHPRG